MSIAHRIRPELLEWRKNFESSRYRSIGPRAQARVRMYLYGILSWISRPFLWELLADSSSTKESCKAISELMQPALSIINIATTNISVENAWLSSMPVLYGFAVMEVDHLSRYQPRVPDIFPAACLACARILMSNSPFLRLTKEGKGVMEESWQNRLKSELDEM